MFCLGERVMREALRIGLVYGDIRDAHRAGDLSLETLKAFAGYPDLAVQHDVFTALSSDGQRVEHWQVKRALDDRGIRQGDALSRFVLDAYRAADGPVAADLIEVDSVLSDPGQAQTILSRKVDDLAEEARRRRVLPGRSIGSIRTGMRSRRMAGSTHNRSILTRRSKREWTHWRRSWMRCRRPGKRPGTRTSRIACWPSMSRCRRRSTV